MSSKSDTIRSPWNFYTDYILVINLYLREGDTGYYAFDIATSLHISLSWAQEVVDDLLDLGVLIDIHDGYLINEDSEIVKKYKEFLIETDNQVYEFNKERLDEKRINRVSRHNT